MGLLEKSQRALAQESQRTEIPEKKGGLRERANALLRELGLSLHGRKKSLRERASFLLAQKIPITPSQEKTHKGLLARAKELLANILKQEDEKKNLSQQQLEKEDSSKEQESIELSLPPNPGDEVLEHVFNEETRGKEESASLDPSVQKAIEHFFERLAEAIRGKETHVLTHPQEKVASPFFDDHKTARLYEESYRQDIIRSASTPGVTYPTKDPIHLKEPYYIYPQNPPVEIKDPYRPMPLKLTYHPQDIAVRGTPDYSHLRTLQNAESLLREGRFDDALALLYRTLPLLVVEENREKLQRNIADIEAYLDKEKDRLSLAKSIGIASEAKNIEQRIEKASFQIANAPIEAQNIQIVAPGTPPSTVVSKETGSQSASSLLPMASELAQGGPSIASPARGLGILQEGESSNQIVGVSSPAAATQLAVERALSPETRAAELKEPSPTSAPHAIASGGGGGGAIATSDVPPDVAETNIAQQSQEGSSGEKVSAPPPLAPLAPSGEAYEPPFEEREEKKNEGEVQEIRGVLELKPPEEEDTPFLTLTYDFQKIPHEFTLSKDHQIFEYAYYKYKPMLLKAHKYLKRKQITKALNYYRVIREQQIPPEFRKMIDRNIQDITEYLQKYLMARQ
ncbi:MAG: hypothetical protein NZM25_10910 [Leptospiraceae bacterium]|nr:hypothetical protein [Leptospiraceae bacterium]MDW8305939.1 hypothetical protein [Leptospiraceae bacterium]